MKRLHFLTRKAHARSTRRHPRYHHSQSRRQTRRLRSGRSKRRHWKGGYSNMATTATRNGVAVIENAVIANSRGKVYSLKNARNALQNTETAELLGDNDS